MKRARILVVEDEQITQMHLCLCLESAGHHVIGTADNAADAIRLAEQEQPDLILMDVSLRGEPDGIAAATTIRAARPIPVIFLTAYADTATTSRASIVQPAGYVVKPFEEDELDRVIATVIKDL
jgi:CheY-like chemotaxis protein